MSLVVTRAFGLITIQDLGRPGRMHEALPPGGALVAARLAAANRAVGNPAGAPAIEIMGSLAVRATAELAVASDAWPVRVLGAGEELTVDSEPRRVTYLAFRGGVEAPLVLGGRGAQLSAGIGALVRTGDRIAVGAPSAAAPGAPEHGPSDGPIRVIAGPDPEAFEARALEVLVSSEYRIAASSDRVGTRLEGPRIPRTVGYVEASRPMVCGAIEVPRDGVPIVLGPEHPTSGGYPVVAVVAHAELGRLFSVRIGGTVRFAVGARHGG